MKMLPLPSLIRASAWDAGNAHMRAAGRDRWSRDDFNEATRTQERLISACYGEGATGCIKFSIAEALERTGHLEPSMKARDFFALVNEAYEAA